MTEKETPVKTIDRFVRILASFTVDQQSWSLGELSERLEVPKSSLHRFLSSLKAHGILYQGPGDRRWRLGYRLSVWGKIAQESTTLRNLAKPIMQMLAEAADESVFLFIYQDQEAICIEKIEAARPVRVSVTVGSRHPLHAGAGSKALLAFLPEKEIEVVIRERGLPKLCKNTITNPQDLKANLALIRAQGYAESFEETDLDARGIATPVFDWNGKVAAVLAIAGPSSRLKAEQVPEYAELCRRASQQISERIGA